MPLISLNLTKINRDRGEFMKQKKLIALVCLVATLFAIKGEAAYKSSTDTGADKLDILENMRRHARENALTPEQKNLLKVTGEMRQNLRRELDPTKPVPTAFEGEELTYDQNTGEFTAVGKVHIIQLDNHQFDSEMIRGNTIDQEIEIPEKSHMLQLTDNMPRVTLDGYHTFYNYGTKSGTMENASGKVDHQYVSGKRFEFYPDHVIIYDGTTTKCSAKVPDYHLSAEKITIWPNDRMILDNVKYWVKDKIIYTRDRVVQNLGPDAKGPDYPRMGYNSKSGVWLAQDFNYNLARNVNAKLHLFASSKQHVRPYADVTWENAHSTYILTYGYQEDNDNNWIKKEPSFIYRYGDRIGNLPLSYGLEYEIGRWSNNGITSTHSKYTLGLAHDMIVFDPSWYLFLGTSFSVTRESANDSTVRGWNVDTTLLKYFDDTWAAYLGYYYASSNKENALFAYGLRSYDRKMETGLSYRMDDKNRFVVGFAFDLTSRRLRDIDYYWFHDIHCSQLVLRYRAKRREWQAHWEFIPW